MMRTGSAWAAAASCFVLSLLAAPARAQPAAYGIDPTHTFVTLELLHRGMSTVRVRFERKQAELQFDRAGRSGHVEFTLDMASLKSGVPAFDALLKGADFFNVAQHPSAVFTGNGFAFDGDKLSQVTGTLALRGVVLPVSFKTRQFNCYTSPLFRREVCGGDFEATLQRSAWGLSALPGVADDSVRVLVQIEAIRQ